MGLFGYIYYSEFSLRRRDVAAWRVNGLTVLQNGGRHLAFSKFLRHPICIILPNFIKLGRLVAEISDLLIFQDNGRPPYWIL